MSAVRDRESIDRGAELAKDLGWPEDQIGLLGATAGLADLGAGLWTPRSTKRWLRRYRERSQQEALDRVTESVKRLSQ
jgi:hypothetical protein